jgi:hypothetical protein
MKCSGESGFEDGDEVRVSGWEGIGVVGWRGEGNRVRGREVRKVLEWACFDKTDREIEVYVSCF